MQSSYTTSPQKRSLRPTRQEIVLIFITMVWGGTYGAMQWSINHSNALFFVGARFTLAGVLTTLPFIGAIRRTRWQDIKAGVIIGLPACAGQVFQALGLETITTSQSAFLSALYIPIIPLLHWVLTRKPLSRPVCIGLVLAFIGVMLISGQDLSHFHLNNGDLLTILAAIGMAFEITLISYFAETGVNIPVVTIIQLFMCGVIPFSIMPLMHVSLPTFSFTWLWPITILALASIGIQLAMNWAQKSIPPARAAIIYAAEPVWGGLFGWLLGEQLGLNALCGAALIVTAVILSEWSTKPKQSTD